MTGPVADLRVRLRNRVEEFLYRGGWKYGSKKKVYLISYPRSGSTLVRTYLSILQGRPQLSIYKGDVVSTSQGPLTRAVDHLALIKSHTFDPNYRDIVYLIRDGRNAMISHLYLRFLWGGHQFSKLEEISDGLKRLSDEGYFWGDHVREALAEATRKNLLVVKYEDLLLEPQAQLRRIVQFMGAELPDQILDECVRLARQETSYFEKPTSGYLYEPEPNSIYDLLKKYRFEAYWKRIFDQKAKRYFHDRGGTEFLLKFGYEESEQWWSDEGAADRKA